MSSNNPVTKTTTISAKPEVQRKDWELQLTLAAGTVILRNQPFPAAVKIVAVNKRGDKSS